MNPISRWMGALALAFSAAAAQAIPVHVTQTFSDVTWDFEGFTNSVGFGQVISGDWIFKGIFDSETPREAGNQDIGGAWRLSSLSLTQASLGLQDAAILNVSYVTHFIDNVGFAYSWLVYPDTRTTLPDGTFVPPYTPNPFAMNLGPVAGTNGVIRPRDEGFLFADGSRLFGYGSAGSSTFGAVVSPVPEPETWLAMMVGLAALAGRFAKRRADAAQPAMPPA
jgi:hypothetical protein